MNEAVHAMAKRAPILAAAPDLYAACKRALDEMDGRPQGPGTAAILRAALAKSGGVA